VSFISPDGHHVFHKVKLVVAFLQLDLSVKLH